MPKLVILKYSETEYCPAIIENDKTVICHSRTTTSFYPDFQSALLDHRHLSLDDMTEMNRDLYENRPYSIQHKISSY